MYFTLANIKTFSMHAYLFREKFCRALKQENYRRLNQPTAVETQALVKLKRMVMILTVNLYHTKHRKSKHTGWRNVWAKTKKAMK
jgi:hypothetical protein